jgi:uncharacterized radical SAM superfamily Fe-S cluster-containing enzyme
MVKFVSKQILFSKKKNALLEIETYAYFFSRDLNSQPRASTKYKSVGSTSQVEISREEICLSLDVSIEFFSSPRKKSILKLISSFSSDQGYKTFHGNNFTLGIKHFYPNITYTGPYSSGAI